MAQSRKLTTVQAALRVLAHLLAHPEGLEASQVARLLGKSLSTAYALLASLVAEGFAERVGTTYRASQNAISAVPSRSVGEGNTVERLHDALEELYLRTRERTYLGLLTREGRLRLQSRGRQGQPKPPGLEGESTEALHALALGKAVLAFLEGEPPGQLRAYTPNTLTEPVALQDELHRVRQMGFAVEIEEFAQGISAVAAPISACPPTSSTTPSTTLWQRRNCSCCCARGWERRPCGNSHEFAPYVMVITASQHTTPALP